MAMTKAEQKRVADLEQALAMARALRWPDYPEPAPMTRQEIEANLVPGGFRFGRQQWVARGWFYNSYDRGTVARGCSDGLHHSRRSVDVTDTQEMGRMYRTEADAWRMIRIEKTREMAEILARLDRKIAEVEGRADEN